MKTVFLGYKSKKLESYKAEMEKIRNCITCGDEIVESGSYGELGYIVQRKEGERPGWYYEFAKLCPNCFGQVNELLGRIHKESRKAKESAHAKD